MTHKQWVKLSPEEQRIKIASLLGIVDIEEVDWTLCDIRDIGLWEGRLNGEVVNVPDYCNDLNAMQAAWMTLTSLQKVRFMEHLSRTAVLKNADYWIEEFPGMSAAQHAEAFVLTMQPEAE
jgi:hypothetical protein